MAGIIQPRPVNGSFTDFLRWATSTLLSGATPTPTTGATNAPSAAQELTGWQPQSVAPPPDFRSENWRNFTLYQWLMLFQAAGLFMERSAGLITVNAVTVGGTHTVTLGGHLSGTYTVPVGATTSTIAAGIAAMLVADATIGEVATFLPSANAIEVIWNDAGHIPALANGGTAAGDVALTAPTTPIMRQPTPDSASWADSRDLVVGAKQADDDASHANRIIWRKTKGSFAAGSWSGTQADDANTGANSINLGVNCKAAADQSIAMGAASTVDATSDHSQAIGAVTIDANADHSTGIGPGGIIDAGASSAIVLGYGRAKAANSMASGTAIATQAGENAWAGAQVVAAGKSQAITLHGGAQLASSVGDAIVPGMLAMVPRQAVTGTIRAVAVDETPGGGCAEWEFKISLYCTAAPLVVKKFVAVVDGSSGLPVWAAEASPNKTVHTEVAFAAGALDVQLAISAGKIDVTLHNVSGTTVRFTVTAELASIIGA